MVHITASTAVKVAAAITAALAVAVDIVLINMVSTKFPPPVYA